MVVIKKSLPIEKASSCIIPGPKKKVITKSAILISSKAQEKDSAVNPQVNQNNNTSIILSA